MILTNNLRDDQVLDFKLVKETTDEVLLESLLSVMKAPRDSLGILPKRPAQIHFDNRRIFNALLPALQSIGVRGRYLPKYELVNEIISILEEEFREGEPEIPGLLSTRKVTTNMVRDLYKAAADFYRAAPWIYLTDRDILSIRISLKKEPFYVSIMGQAGVEYGLALYKKWEDVQQMFSIYDSIDEVIPLDGSHSLLFEEISAVPFDDLDAIEQYGWEIADPQAYPIPFVFTLDNDFQRPKHQDILMYQAALLAVPIFVNDHLGFDKENKIQPAEAEIPVVLTTGSQLVKITFPAGVLIDEGGQVMFFDADKDEQETKLPFDRRGLEGEMVRMVGPEYSYDFETDLGKAQDIVYQAWDENNPARRIILAHEALKISPDCADAYVLLAEEEADSFQTELDYYKKGIEAGERALRDQFFEENVGYFWGIVKSCPYMRALYGYANCCWVLDKKEETVRIYEEMLRLNPGDNQGIRYELVGCYLNLNRMKELEQLLGEYEGDASAVWYFTQALVIFNKQGRSTAAKKALASALEYNPYAADYLLARKRIPNRLPEFLGFGNEDEAIIYAAEHLNNWRQIPGAVDWLRENAERCLQNK